MAVPNHAADVKKLHDTGLFNLKTHDGHEAFVDATVAMLNGKDPRWRHLAKKPGQTDVHGHGEDSALYLLPDGTAWAVDFIVGAGGGDPRPGWNPDSEAFYTHKDAHDPDDHGIGASHTCPPVPPSFPYPDENTQGKAFQARVKQAYTDANRPFPDPNDQDAFRHFMRYGYSARTMPEPQAADKHIAELRAQLGV